MLHIQSFNMNTEWLPCCWGG